MERIIDLTDRARKNRTYIENLVISEEVDRQLSDGYPLEQAQAIAFRKFRDGELNIPDVNITKEQQKKISQTRENQLKGLFLLWKLGQMVLGKDEKKT